MQNCIINESPNYQKEEIYQKFILKSIEDFKDNKDISLKCKILHYLNKPTFYYYLNVHKNNNINPFDKEILFCFEFINGEIPYATIMTDFSELYLNDGRNLFRCLSKNHNYIFSLEKFDEMKNILKEMILGIKNFLYYVKETIEINYFIYFGEYEFNHIYQINDFLSNMNNFSFYRIYEVKNNQKIEKFMIFTNLYFIIFQPLDFDKCLMKIKFIVELNKMNLIFDKNDDNGSLILDLSNTNYKNVLEFFLIDRKHIKLKNKNDFKFDKEKDDKEKDYSTFLQEWFTHQNNNIIQFKKYDAILTNYRILFSGNKDIIDLVIQKDFNIEENKKFLEFFEKILSYYETKKDQNKERIDQIIAEYIYLCSELVNYDKNQSKKDNKYIEKIKKFLESYKKK